jgi:hypothetical protein
MNLEERNELLQINRSLTTNQEETGSSRIEPPIGANRSIYQTTLRCFPTMREVLSGQGKGVVKETLQVFT